MSHTKYLAVVATTASLLASACGSAKPLSPQLTPIRLADAQAAPLERDLFARDHVGGLSEEDMRRILAAPVFLEERARIGIVPVSNGYGIDDGLPTAQIPGVLADRLEDSALFEVVTEVSADWPSTTSISGLRELAARYRSEYLLLYRHRFVDRSYTNAWALGWVTVVGAFVLPHRTMETAGVVEATLFDVKSGTLLFTVFDRVRARSDENIWHSARKRRDLKAKLLADVTGSLTDEVLEKLTMLVAARPAPAPAQDPRAPTPASRVGQMR